MSICDFSRVSIAVSPSTSCITWLELNIESIIVLVPFRCRTIALETGFQNSQLCSTIIQLSFSFEDLELMFAFPLIYSIFQLVVAIIFVGGKRPTEVCCFS